MPHGRDTLELVLGHLNVELLLEAHHELDEVEAVGLEVLLEPGLLSDLRGLHREHLDGDLAHRVESDVAVHDFLPWLGVLSTTGPGRVTTVNRYEFASAPSPDRRRRARALP